MIQPVTDAQTSGGVYGPQLQVEMFAAGEPPNIDQLERFAVDVRALMGAANERG